MAPVTIALDAMGGDRAPEEVVAGAVSAAADGIRVLLCGPTERLTAELSGHGTPDGVEVVEAPGVIGSHDEPAVAVRSRPDSSLVTACRLVREGRAGAAVSAGPTGAMLAASLLVIGRIRGVARPGIAVLLPARGGPCVLIDAGANAESRPEHLVQFAVMGSLFAEHVLGIERPPVALLSIGEEASKGNTLTTETHPLLEAADLHFVGNCEGRDVLRGEVRVVVCDGFTGNVLLKGLEGAGEMLFRELRAAASSSLRAKLGGLLLMPALREVRRRTDPESYGGAYLLGLRGLAVIAHGNSSRRAVHNALSYAAKGVSGDVAGRLAGQLAQAGGASDLQQAPPARTVPLVADPENGDT
jgi:phosphate acyltransferase